MSEYCSFEFTAKPAEADNIKKQITKLFDAVNVDYLRPYNAEFSTYSLVIHELNLREAIPLLAAIKKKHKGVSFLVTYGVY
jgi:hypothetical protein